MAVSVVSICNRALQKVGSGPISSINGTGSKEIACQNTYEPCRDALLRAHPWVFAIKRVEIAASIPSPIFGYSTAFLVPSDFLRLHGTDSYPDLALNVSGIGISQGIVNGPVTRIIENVPTSETPDVNGNIPTATAILSNEQAPIQVRYIAKVEDPNQMDPLFREALAAFIAVEICEILTQNATKKRGLLGELQARIMEARRNQGIEAPPQDPATDDWVLVRL